MKLTLVATFLFSGAVASAAQPTVEEVGAPAGMNTQHSRWIRISTAGSGVMLAAVARPPGKGPFPVVMLLHGSHGFAPEYVRWAEELAKSDVLVMAPCWFSGGGGAGARAVSPSIACPEARVMPMAMSTESLAIITDLIAAARILPDARSDRVALIGHSRGAGATLNYLVHSNDVRAAILNSSGYGDELSGRAIHTPLLILHGTADAPADGGSPFTSIDRARAFEAAQRQAGGVIEAHYYDGGRHTGIFLSAAQHADSIARMSQFLRKHLQ